MMIGNIGGELGGGCCGGAGRQQPTSTDMEFRTKMQAMSGESKMEFRTKMQAMSGESKMEFKSDILNLDDSKSIEDFIAMLLDKNESLVGTHLNISA